MKPQRVRLSALAVFVVLLVFFLVPLPVSRIRETAVVELQPQAVEKVFAPPAGGFLKELRARNGETVEKGSDILAKFHNLDLSIELDDAAGKARSAAAQVELLQQQASRTTDAVARHRIDQEIVRQQGEVAVNARRVPTLERMKNDLELKAPRSGIVLGLPRVDEIGQYWEAQQGKPFCIIGDPSRLRVLVALTPADYRLLEVDRKAEWAEGRELEVTLRVQGRMRTTWKGVISQMPQSEAKEVPGALTTKYGGPLAFKPAGPNSETFVPLSQVYLVGIDIIDSDGAIAPGTLAQVKIHCRWRPCSWWVWRAISSTFDLGLM